MANLNKITPTRTINPLHFEDLDPHRFEDLVRSLTHEFRDWQKIEATGRSGNDEGIDIRAWEKSREIAEDEDEEREEKTLPMEGNLWIMQCKREKTLSPKEIQKIINDGVNKSNPPYGYILAASTSFSKKSYDMFREELRNRGVMEFYLWGRGELEDMLYMPKNDSILFAFTGISLISKKRSRSSEIKFVINNKNKLCRILSEGNFNRSIFQSVLARDFNDKHYPYESKYEDFNERPHWKEYIVVGYDPKGLIVQACELFAYIDRDKKVWDFTLATDLLNRRSDTYKENDKKYLLREKVEDYWRHLPRANKAKLLATGLILFEDILVIDEKGDSRFDFPHIYIDFSLSDGFLKRKWGSLKIEDQELEINDTYKKIEFFPKEFPDVKKIKVNKDKKLTLDEETLRFLRIGTGKGTLYDVGAKYTYLEVRSSIEVASNREDEQKLFFEVTHMYNITVSEYLKKQKSDSLKNAIELQVGRSVKNDEKMTVFEIERISEYNIHV